MSGRRTGQGGIGWRSSGGPARLGCAIAAASLAAGCGGLDAVDRQTERLLADTNETTLGSGGVMPTIRAPYDRGVSETSPDEYRTDPPTANPSADELRFTAATDADILEQRLKGYGQPGVDATRLDLRGAMAYAIRQSREYRFAEEQYILAALGLMSERHLWGPRLFDELSAEFVSIGDDGTYDSALLLVNELALTQRLPYGGDVTARLVAAATEDLHRRVAGENIQTADLILEANVPLLRGAGMVAREDLIQAERNVVYAARAFERFRREYLFAITVDFLDLVVLQLEIVNAERQVATLEEFQVREESLVDAGRAEPFQAALAAQRTLFALDSLNTQQERYHLAVDRFRVRLGMPENEELVIVASTPGLPVPETTMDDAVRAGLAWRLDLQNRRDFVDDARRGVAIARNDLLADVDLFASVSLPTDESLTRAGLAFDIEDPVFRAGVNVGFPIDRKIERINLRASQISLERSVRDYDEFRDNVAVEIRNAVRNIHRALFSETLQQRNVEIAETRLASIEAAPERASARDRSEAADDLLSAQNDYLAARRDVQLAILGYLLATGQLRVDPDGTIHPLEGMEISPSESPEVVDPEAATPPDAPRDAEALEEAEEEAEDAPEAPEDRPEDL